MNKLKLVFITLLLFTPYMLHAQITVTLQQPPPFQFKIENFWRVVLVNLGEDPVNVYLIGTATDQSEERIIEATSSVITVQRGTRILTGRDLGPFEIHEAENQFSNLIARTGSIPSGNYDICIQVYDANTNRSLGYDCVQVTVENLSRIELVNPLNSELINDLHVTGELAAKTTRVTNNTPIIFSWLPPVPTPPNVNISYKLKVVEMIGYQSAVEAMDANPLYFESQSVKSTALRYPLSVRQFRSGKQYCWKVEVYLDNILVQDSEVRYFTMPGNDDSINENSYTTSYANKQKSITSYSEELLPSGLSAFNLSSYTGSNSNLCKNIFISEDKELDSSIPIEFSGDAKLTGYLSNRSGINSQLPKNYITLEVNPRLTVYNIPLAMNIILSSLNKPSMQSVNSFSLNFDLSQLQRNITDKVKEKILERLSELDSSFISIDSLNKIKDPDLLAETASRLGLISNWEMFFMDIKSLGIGRTYPDYSEFTLQGVPIDGFSIEYNPGILYAAVTAYNNLKGIDDISFNRSALGLRVGIGKKGKEHLYFTLLKLKDDESSAQVTNNQLLTPRENLVIGTEGEINLFHQAINLTGEAAFSVHTRDTRDADYENSSFPGFVNSIYPTKLSTSYDYAWKIKAVIDQKEKNAYYSLGIKRVGPGFVSLGAPNLRSDQLAFETFFNKKFLSKKIGLKTNIKVYLDNLDDWKSSTTSTATIGISLDFTFPQLPYFIISYNPNFQSNDNVPQDQLLKNDFHFLSFMTIYSYQIGAIYATTSVTTNMQIQNMKLGLNKTKYSNTMFCLNQNLSFEFPLSLNSTLSFMKSDFSSASTNTIDFDINSNYQFDENISALLGFNYANEENTTRKTGIYGGCDIIFYEWLSLNFRADYADFKDLSNSIGDFTELIFQASLRVKW